ncbi:MAG: CtsR family transcriptional regulator [Patescibacteria group bacterium]
MQLKGQERSKKMNLADLIEDYLRRLMAEREILEVQRRELARRFGCAPSQINYVLETRFTAARGYLIESRRGGGGYIRICRLPAAGVAAALGERVGPDEVPGVLARLVDEGLITGAEGMLLQRILAEALSGPVVDSSFARAQLLRALLALLGGRKE